MSTDSGPGNREVAYRLFAAEFEDSTVSYSESDEERAPNYVITPTGGRVNRVFLVGVLTETERVGGEQIRGRVVDPTGAFVAYAGQYQPDELAFLDRVEPPAFLAITGKARTFSPEDSDRVYTSVRPESISEVDAATRDRWVVHTAEQTLDRVSTMASALRSDLRGEALRERLIEEGVDPGLASGVALAVEHYGTSAAYLQALRGTALDAVRVVAGERDEVDRLGLAPDEGGTEDAVLAGLAGMDLGTGGSVTGTGVDDATSAGDRAGTTEPTGSDESPSTATEATDAGGEPAPEPGSDATPTPEPEPTDETTERTETVSATTTASSEPESTPSETASEPGPTEADLGETEGSTPAEPGTPVESEPAGTEAGSPTTTTEGSATDDDLTTEEPTEDDPATGADDDFEDFEPGEFELPEEERRQVEEEFGTDFETAGEVDPAGEAGIETAEPDETSATSVEETVSSSETEPASASESPTAATEPEPESETEPEPESETEPEPEAAAETETETETETESEAEADVDVDIDEVTVEAIAELDEGDGAEREAVVSTVAERHGVDPDEVAEAIEAAMMSGRAYEPSDGLLKAI